MTTLEEIIKSDRKTGISKRRGRGRGRGGWRGRGQIKKPGDWICKACNELNFAKRQECHKCEAPREKRDGDWNCPKCGDLVFSFRDKCNQCSAPKPEELGPVVERNWEEADSQTRKDGDWDCSCGCMNFARRNSCFKCGEARSDDGQNFGQTRKPGDWNCSSCSVMNFARRNQCFKCGVNRRGGNWGSWGGNQRNQRNGNNQQKKPGDWFCPMCGDLVFAFRNQCNSCQCPKPNMMQAMMMNMMMGGNRGGNRPRNFY